MDEREDRTIYKVVVDSEKQYSIWQADRKNQPGWTDVGVSGTKEECLDFIKQKWDEMRNQHVKK